MQTQIDFSTRPFIDELRAVDKPNPRYLKWVIEMNKAKFDRLCVRSRKDKAEVRA